MSERRIQIHIPEQALLLFQDGQVARRYKVSTARNGPGQRAGSECTPTGRHRIRLKIGAGCAPGTVFVARRPSGEIWTPELARRCPERDWILSRILWLSGRQPGHNRGGQCDSLRRFIYIHGTPDDQPMGKPRSHGCIRMRNADIIDLFDRVERGDPVDILDTC
jgi:lipoprotein-anchoring transpeptidase ErfK/SrfK